jgi:putative membrane-bound dehydrogenase-like protein
MFMLSRIGQKARFLKGIIPFAAFSTVFFVTAPAFSQACPEFTFVRTNTVDANWPDSTTNGFGYFKNMTLPLSPDSSKPCIKVPTGFNASLWASERSPMGGVRSMVAMNWDEKGRLWGVETRDYPNTVLSNPLPGGGGTDRIVIIEDLNGDGIVDSRKVFAQGFNLLTGIVHTANGIIVSMPPHILLFKDDNNDDVADNPSGTILYTGFGRSDTHATLSNLTYGLDNWIYATNGYSGGTNINNPATSTTFAGSWSQRIVRFKSDGSMIEAITSLSNNTWGLGISETGHIFASTANRDHSVHQVYPGASRQTPIYTGTNQSYVAQAGSSPAWANPHPITKHININNGGYPATSNHSLYTARQFPQKYWDRVAFTCDGPHHLCHEVNLSPLGSTFRGAEDTASPNIFASTDPWSAPIQAHVGPDGALWVLDWYNYLMNHNGVCGKIACGTGAAQISNIRDTVRTRIYRVFYNSRPVDPILNLTTATEDQLLATFSHTNLLWRLQAQRLLLKRGSNAGLVTKLTNMLNQRSVNDMGESPEVIHAIRTLQGFGLFTADPVTWVPVLKGLMLHPSQGVRWNAIDALPVVTLSTTAILEQGRINDPNAHVRIMALYKLTTLPGAKSGEMYTPYVTLDTYSQSRFSAITGLTQSATMPAIPPLQSTTGVVDGSASRFLRPITVSYRRDAFVIRDMDPRATGTLTVVDVRGAQVARLAIENGQASGTVAGLKQGTYLFNVQLRNGDTFNGKISVFN